MKKAINIHSTRTQKVELQSLYARRTAIDALIRSLEEYHRCRSKRLYPRKGNPN
ncbi:MAG: hypothetical protein LAQ30_01730 [Acidobacteriia bacterium]|nr:hypothetical protein [Terriglobia bacterium]